MDSKGYHKMYDYTEYNDEQLTRLTSAGDRKAFAEIYYRYSEELYIQARNATGDSDLAEDIVQEVFVSFWQRRNEVTIQSVKGWLLTSIRFQVLKAFRREKSNSTFHKRLTQLQESSNLNENDPIVYKEFTKQIQVVVKSLPNDQLTIFRMHREEDLSYHEIADRLGISVKTVEKKMSLALRQFRSGLEIAVAVLFLMVLSC